MDTQFLSSLLAVLDEGSIAAAARREGVTASAVSQRVAALEVQLATPLLRRAGRVMQPTPECQSLLPAMRRMLALEQDMKAALRGAVLAGPLRLGAISTALGDHAAGLLRCLRNAAPEVTLELVPGTSQSLYEMMEQNRLDAAVLVEPPFALPKSLAFFATETQPIGLLSAGPGPLPYLIYSRTAWGGALCWQALSAREPNPEILAEMDALEVMAHMVEAGVAQAVLPHWRGLARFPQAVFHPWPGALRRVGLLVHQRDAAGALVALLRQGLNPQD